MRNKTWWLAGAAAVALVVVVAWSGRGDAAPGQAAAPQPGAAGSQFFGQVGASAGVAAAPGERTARLQEIRQHFELVDQTLCNYAASTKYPEASRPAAEHPDQLYPNEPVAEAHPMRTPDGKSDGNILIQTSQSRVFMASGEMAAFSIRAVDPAGKPMQLVVTRAAAQGMTFQGARPTTQIAIPFADDGKGADAVSGDGAFAGILAPAQTGLASFNGTIRTEVRYTVGGKTGFVLFDVIYTPELPAVWTGQVREGVEEGSLVFYLKADVRIAGRYIVHGRVDDAKGKPFALATFNDTLPAGPAEVKLTVFGKLMRDKEAAMPLTLRDVDGFLLKENVDPDRALMPRLEGKVLVGKPHALKTFSDAEWQSEERSRHLVEFSKDVALAQGAFSKFDPAVPVPKSACMP
ncbi:MAG: choice-of-anchor X domain-containing protein [Pseudomonadota bacterium]